MRSDELHACLVQALQEDLGSGDVTTRITVPDDLRAARAVERMLAVGQKD